MAPERDLPIGFNSVATSTYSWLVPTRHWHRAGPDATPTYPPSARSSREIQFQPIEFFDLFARDQKEAIKGRRRASSRISSSSRSDQIYRCYPASTSGKPHLEDGDKVILPASALNTLAALRIEYPMQFELHHANTNPAKASHCGVLEFVAEEGAMVMPEWMMTNMGLGEGDLVRVRSAALPKGTYVKLRPHTSEFLDITNPKAVLEKTLRTFSCFTTGDTIMVSYNSRKYYIDIVETKPASAVSIVETDCEVDFAPPLDYKEPEKPRQQQPSVDLPAASKNKVSAADGGEGDTVVKDGAELFKPFTGSGKRLDGKEALLLLRLMHALHRLRIQTEEGERGSKPSGAASSSSSRQKTGKLVFGGSTTSNSKEAQKAAVKQQAEEPAKKDEPKFQAFTGKSYSLQPRQRPVTTTPSLEPIPLEVDDHPGAGMSLEVYNYPRAGISLEHAVHARARHAGNDALALRSITSRHDVRGNRCVMSPPMPRRRHRSNPIAQWTSERHAARQT
ncbi:hypothetical protein HU200_005365 [Digitaria exilis]|uniref:Ubiquitin fusion degradaton protein n=1 Tax=Digitaria exilis TaxID=1010633 RepID=A0A835FSZ6_9POAL|nr:hypothetical protein HU200_005365 [Digitaria exilis]